MRQRVASVAKFSILLNLNTKTKLTSSLLLMNGSTVPAFCISARLCLSRQIKNITSLFPQTIEFSHLLVADQFYGIHLLFRKPTLFFHSQKVGNKCTSKPLSLMNFFHSVTNKKQLSWNNTDASVSKQTKHALQRLSLIIDDEIESMPSSNMTIEKQILHYIQVWQLEKAVNLLKVSLKSGMKPDMQVILRLLEHLSSLGEVKCLLELNEILKSSNINFGSDFYKCLHIACCISGKIEESIAMLITMYESATDPENIDVFFYLLTTKVIMHFPHRINMVINLVDELQRKKQLLPSARAYLWCSFVQAEKFSTADKMLQEDKDLKKIIPSQVTKLVQLSNDLDFDRDKVLLWILKRPYIKQGLKASVFDALIIHKCNQKNWDLALNYLSDAMHQGQKIHKDTLKKFLSKFLCEFSHTKVQQFSSWAKN